jgi:hypothetical protein
LYSTAAVCSTVDAFLCSLMFSPFIIFYIVGM